MKHFISILKIVLNTVQGKSMKSTICLMFLLSVSFNMRSQNLRILNTKELMKISEKYGLDSALVFTKGIPIFYIDKTITEQLVKQIKHNKPSYKIEKFLVEYALCMNTANISDILYEYFFRKKDEIKEYLPDSFGGLPRISQNSLFALIENPSKQTDSLLWNYYEMWNEKSTFYQQDYEKGVEESYERKKAKLMSPYENCQYNCYILQRFLKEIKSPFYNQEKMEYHQKKLVYYLRNGFGIGKNTDCSKYNNATGSNIYKSIKLTKNYNSIGDIDFEKEAELKKMFSRYNEPHCWKFLIYNKKNGYLDLGCQSGHLAGVGVFYKIELKKNNLIIYELYSWVS